ncbi:radical SAM family heme chaperone HemW [Flavobacteriaceae bacterium XHP0103]|uniref:radical SAM family heme chaperone HemW n=1 Tax=Marixanthotalea marina TaxID=2844359 RepID=UPI00384F8BE2|nr:radical SAM family heme chaperone HemW [Marixanthotalea marina]
MAGIYLHIPFCKQACYYCDFYFSTSLKKKDELIDALIKELELRKNELQGQFVETIYFGGGTPSLLKQYEIQSILDTINRYYRVAANPEITLEANPDDLTEEVILQLSESPVNRLSIGVQSFFEDDLKSMNRAHNAEEAKACLKLATQYFDNITIDLIYGIPNMSLEKWDKNLKTVFDFGINHISSYALTVEPNTALENFIKKGKYLPIDDQLALQHFNHLVEKTAEQGFVQYEISNFGKPDYFSKHNTSYWQGKPYLGIGPSAHSFNGNERSWNVRNNSIYINSLSYDVLPLETETLSENDKYNEYVMTGLRTIWGVSFERIENEFGKGYLAHLKKSAQKFIDEGLLVSAENILKVTQNGKFLADGIASELFKV